MKHLYAAGLSLLAVCATATTTSAHADQTDQGGNGWRYQLTPYLWMTGMNGHLRPLANSPTAHVNESFSELLSNLDAALFLSGTARQGQYVLQGDLSYASVSDKASLPLGLTANTRLRQTALTLTGGINRPLGTGSSLDLMAGVRLWDIKARVQVPGLGSFESREHFADPILAARWHHSLGPRWSSLVYADAGGFGVGSDSTWQIMASLNYEIRNSLYLSFGYRHLKVNYRDGGQRLDFSMSGPLVGATYRF
ncbi:outer membrane beta-barrel protein [Comamonas composti]|uniref:outer membrane beta-barrel protein n=1 Tax=Comamonas composti TaxID=408558 RepID=UPI000418D2EF|nr:outer membrane beta-barrel protein [Comamonas composti]